MPSVLPKQANTLPTSTHPADNAVRAIEYAMQELVSSDATTDQVAEAGSRLSNDSSLITAIQTSLTARTS
jgi:hypothetical protein